LTTIENIAKAYKNYIWKLSYSILQDSYLAEDATQETLIILNRNLEKIDLESPKAHGFITVVARHKAYEFYHRQKKYALGSEEDLASHIREPMDHSGELISAIHSLSPLYSTVLLLSYVHGYSDAEIAKILDIAPATVRKRKERARDKLQSVYYGEEGQ
jgi:RNA polymerase sigma-70 factor (ECF subfamily)